MATAPVLPGENAGAQPTAQLNGIAGPAPAPEPRPPAAEIRPARGVLARFPPGPRSVWASVPDASWNDWTWQQRERITTLAQLEGVLRVTDDERRAAVETEAEFHMGITPYYAALMDPDDPTCPVRQQSVPTMGELQIAPADLEDPLAEERDMPVPGITHRYPDRVLFYTTHNCPVYCRHCTRKRKVADPTSAAAKKQIEDGLAYIAAHPEIRDVATRSRSPTSGSTTSWAGCAPSRTSTSSGSARATS
jgi:lysine 2,3-aminomutase